MLLILQKVKKQFGSITDIRRMEAKELKKRWPAVEKKIREGDILLVHSRRSYISKLIRNDTGSYWNHAAVVFNTSDIMLIGCPLIAEATYGGIEIHQIKNYTENFDFYDVGVLRDTKLSPEERKEVVRSFILNELDTPYDYPRLIAHHLGRMIGKYSTRLQIEFQKTFMRTHTYLCSTFVHRALHDFNDGAHALGDNDAKEAFLHCEEMYTPADLALDPELTWVFNKHR